jgi:alpha-glucosidase (family GH31 glycosyl hydrolase)
LGTIIRFHQGDHRFWTFDNHTQEVVRSLLELRYRLAPSLIAASHQISLTGFPIVARLDLFWPEHNESSGNTQYIHLNDSLVAPMLGAAAAAVVAGGPDGSGGSGGSGGSDGAAPTTRAVFIPPGDWEDAWNGTVVSGPQTIVVTKPPEQIPMWHRHGGMIVTTSNPGLRIEQQDWRELTLEAFPKTGVDYLTTRSVFALGSGARTDITMATTAGSTEVRFTIGTASDGEARAWVVRLHLRPGQQAARVTVDGAEVEQEANKAADDVASSRHFFPRTADTVTLGATMAAAGQPAASAETKERKRFAPLGGADTFPPAAAGPVVQVRLPAGASSRLLEIDIDSL